MRLNPYHIMGIVNVTPDSFSDGGKFLRAEKAINHALSLIAAGADSVDIGGESTRPNANIIPDDEEIARVLPVVTALKQKNIFVSVDTRNAKTMRAVIEAGADMINDVSALHHDPESLSVIADSNVKICLMHMQGTPQTMQQNPHYVDVVQEVKLWLQSRIEACENAGIEKDRIIIDVGIGFGKTLQHNLTLLNNLAEFQELGCPIMLGTSRKSFIKKIMGEETPPDARTAGSIASILSAYQRGVKLFRVHDVKETKQALNVWNAIESGTI